MLARHDQSVVSLINFLGDLPPGVPAAFVNRIDRGIGMLRRAATVLPVRFIFLIHAEQTSTLIKNSGPEEIVVADPLNYFSGDDLQTRLGSPQRHCIFLGGVWLDEDVLAAALCTLHEGFDTRILIDLTVARTMYDRSATVYRLNQHGALVTTVRQTLVEWALASDDALVRSELKSILAGTDTLARSDASPSDLP